MAWYYTEPRAQRRPLDTPVRPAGGATGGPPTGPAGGDLTGSYPNPDLAAGVVGTPELATGAVTNAKVTDVAYAKITGAPTIPTTLPPSGPAGGDLTGTYPNPTIGAGKVTNTTLASGIDAAKITVGTLPVAQVPNLDAAKITTGTLGQARLPVSPSGLLTANLNDSQVTDAKIAGMAYSKLTGAPTALPPSGAASGDLGGSYPGPTIAKLNGATVGTTTPLARGDVLVANATPALTRLGLGANGTVLQSNGTDAVWGTPLGGPPSGTAGGDLTGTYPNPTIGALKVTDAKVNDVAATKLTGTIAQARFPSAPSGLLTANLNDGQVTTPKLADGAVTFAKRGEVAQARVRRAAAASISNAASEAVIFDTIVENVGGLYSAGTPSRFTIQVAGFYLIGGGWSWAVPTSTAGLDRDSAIALNTVGNWISGDGRGPPTNVNTTAYNQVVTMQKLAAADILFLIAYQDSGAALNIAAGAEFWIVRLG